MAKMGVAREFLQFLAERKLMWMAPIVVILLSLSLFIFFTEGSVVLPFIYMIF